MVKELKRDVAGGSPSKSLPRTDEEKKERIKRVSNRTGRGGKAQLERSWSAQVSERERGRESSVMARTPARTHVCTNMCHLTHRHTRAKLATEFEFALTL